MIGSKRLCNIANLHPWFCQRCDCIFKDLFNRSYNWTVCSGIADVLFLNGLFVSNGVFHNDAKAGAKFFSTVQSPIEYNSDMKVGDLARVITRYCRGCNKPKSCFLMFRFAFDSFYIAKSLPILKESLSCGSSSGMVRPNYFGYGDIQNIEQKLRNQGKMLPSRLVWEANLENRP